MRESDFQPGFPGVLVSTSFPEDRGGVIRHVPGPAFVPAMLPPPLDRDRVVGRMFETLDRARSNLLRLEGLVDSLPEPGVLLRAMRLREVQASSRIENTVASLTEMALAEAGASVKEEAVEVHRNRLAIERGLASRLPISARLSRELHRVLMGAENPRARPGMLRDRQVYIGDEGRGFARARFVPPPPGIELERCLRDWELFANPRALEAPEREHWPELIELAMAHYQFEAIHPFSDGNGRLGRALVNIAPVKSGYLKHPVCNISEWMAGHRQEYYDKLLRVSTHNAWEEWIEFFCHALAEQAALDRDRAGRVSALRKRYQTAVTTKRNSALLGRLVDHLFTQQVVSIPRVAEYLGVTYPAAQKHVEFLVAQRVLSPVSRSSYGKLYIARGIIRAIQGAE